MFSLSIELVQMFGRGSTDVNDLITNTVGAVIGYFIYKLLFSPGRRELHKRFKAESKNDVAEAVCFIGCSFIIMVTLQPILISGLFRLG